VGRKRVLHTCIGVAVLVVFFSFYLFLCFAYWPPLKPHLLDLPVAFVLSPFIFSQILPQESDFQSFARAHFLVLGFTSDPLDCAYLCCCLLTCPRSFWYVDSRVHASLELREEQNGIKRIDGVRNGVLDREVSSSLHGPHLAYVCVLLTVVLPTTTKTDHTRMLR